MLCNGCIHLDSKPDKVKRDISSQDYYMSGLNVKLISIYTENETSELADNSFSWGENKMY